MISQIDFILAFFILMGCITIHELSHQTYLRWRKIDYESGIDDKGFFSILKNIGAKDVIGAASIGIFAGMMPFIFYHNYIVFCLYLGGCFHDFKAIFRNVRRL